jgi:AcrR family transcriptional regulator
MLDDEQPSSPYRTGEVMVAQIRTPHSTWIDAGLQALAAGGPDAVRVDLLAKALGVTRGGFYHHFAGRQVFLDALLDAWEQRCTDDVLLDAWEQRCTDDVLARVEEEGGDARAKVRRAGMLTFSRELLPIDLAVRDWARRDKSVARRLRRVDNRRMDYLRELIGTFSDDPDEVEAQGMLAFSLAIGSHFIAADHRGRSRQEVLDRAAQRLLA